jgi:outer membrane lipoprotein carrier protein
MSFRHLEVLTAAVLVLGPGWQLRGQAIDVSALLNGVEKRYNSAQSLEVRFTESLAARGPRRAAEKGVLTLRKPGKMRWQYSEPAGKLFVSDGQYIYSYFPDENRAEKIKFKATDDMRAPLAFLLGRLNFRDDFREFRASPQEGGTLIAATPKSDKFPYLEVSFLVAPDFSIRRLIVKGQDNTVLEYSFDGEKRNPAVADASFRFSLPPGAEFVDATQ